MRTLLIAKQNGRLHQKTIGNRTCFVIASHGYQELVTAIESFEFPVLIFTTLARNSWRSTRTSFWSLCMGFCCRREWGWHTWPSVSRTVTFSCDVCVHSVIHGQSGTGSLIVSCVGIAFSLRFVFFVRFQTVSPSKSFIYVFLVPLLLFSVRCNKTHVR
jgi:hypothetical protein